MAYRVRLYADSSGAVYTARQTDARVDGTLRDIPIPCRTVNGRVVCPAGEWFGSQLGYGAARQCVASAAVEAARLELLEACGLSADTPEGVLLDWAQDHAPEMGRRFRRATRAALAVRPGYERMSIG